MLTLSSLRTRWAALLGSFVAVALGVGVMTAMGLGLAASLDPPARAPERFGSSPVVVAGLDRLTVEVRRGPGTARVSQRLAYPHPVDERLVAELRALGPVTTDGGGRGSADPDAVGVDAPAADVRAVVGDRARVLTGDARRQVDPGHEREAEALVAVNSLLGTAGGVTTFVSVFVTASTFAFVVALRRREFGLLRMAGATPGQVRRLLLGEALAVGVVASGTGCALGAWGAPVLVRELVDGGVAPTWFAVPDAVVWPYHVAFWTGVSVALAGAWAAARRAGRIGPAEALREASVDTGVLPLSRRVLGAALLAGGLGLLAWKVGTDPADLLKRKTYTTQPMLLVTAAAALAPLLVRPVVRLLGAALPGATGLLIRENAATSVRRTAAVAAPVLVTVALAGSLLGAAGTVARAKGAEAEARTRADFVVTGARADDVVTGARADDVVTGGGRSAGGGRVPGATVAGSASTAVYVVEEGSALVRSEARAVTDVPAFAAVSRLPVVAGDVRDLDDRSIVVNEEWERHEVGDRVRVWLGDGRPVRLRIAAVLGRGTGDNGAYVTSANAGGAAVDRAEVRVDGGADRAGVAAALERAAAGTGATVRPAEEWLAANRPGTRAHTRLGFLVVLGIALVYAAISLAGTLVMATSARGAELRSLRLAGATRGQVRVVVVGEALVAVLVGVALGAAVTVVNLAGVAAALGVLSAPVGVRVPWEVVGACVGACGVVAGVAAGGAVGRAGR
ncbi:ABC transporter permease [Streptomyces stelliscabiei]|uniref:ABC transporter permease n=1 Tax=Streptomyces stelliscabiei TaxID=146820 RepID=UPI0029BC4782|nr:ABC transporter permease [Streptomyces stelliscabiei]MDX2552854.1 ABC transporter permease [Streptomyces stelliscabiei]MDX2613825.1 ABC transporter permease [Streptomyces stelliscabiei]MDX2638056.1 ABC transporter permease [Streptomyces stelliscabiei]MDX2661489.1 ABC transporter permease [Streptomyces stelliscabiei]MDX2713066.1 ABC transporter permease [Streptomyces stelliscabiei]